MTIKTDRRGKAIYYTGACPERSRGNNLDRLIRKQYSGVSGLLSYTYDLNSRLTQVSGALANGTYTFTYDRMGRLTGTTTAYPFLTGRTFTNAYAYDAASNRTSFTDPENGVTTYAYDNLNRLTSLTDFNSNQFGFTYDALSRRTQLSRPNGVNTDYAYDAVGNRLSDLTTANWARNLTSVLISGVTHV